MAKKTILTIIIVGVILLLVGGGIYAFISYGGKAVPPETESTSSDGSASMSATFYDLSGTQPTGGVTQSLISGTSKQTHVKLDLRASNTGTVDLTNIIPVSPNANMDGAFSNVVALASLLQLSSKTLVGTSAQACTNNAGCLPATNEQCCDPTLTLAQGSCTDGTGTNKICLIALDPYASGTLTHNVDFTISLQGSYQDAQGNAKTITSTPVTITWDIREEKCTGGTLINTCVLPINTLNILQFCKFIEGSTPSVVTDCTGGDGIVGNGNDCGCASGSTCNAGGTCTLNKCTDGSDINTYSSASIAGQTVSSITGVTLTAGFAGSATNLYAYNKTRIYCKPDQTLMFACNKAKTDLGSGVLTNEFACKKDANGGFAQSCDPTTGDPSYCQYKSYTGGLSGCVPNCLGKGTCTSCDGCTPAGNCP